MTQTCSDAKFFLGEMAEDHLVVGIQKTCWEFFEEPNGVLLGILGDCLNLIEMIVGLQCGAQKTIAKLVNITTISLGFMVGTTILMVL